MESCINQRSLTVSVKKMQTVSGFRNSRERVKPSENSKKRHRKKQEKKRQT